MQAWCGARRRDDDCLACRPHRGGGYAFISNTILPALVDKGVSEADVQKILLDNPRRALTFTAPQALK